MLVDLARNDLGRVCAPGECEGNGVDGGGALFARDAHRVQRGRQARRGPHGPRRPFARRSRRHGVRRPKIRAIEVIDALESEKRDSTPESWRTWNPTDRWIPASASAALS